MGDRGCEGAGVRGWVGVCFGVWVGGRECAGARARGSVAAADEAAWSLPTTFDAIFDQCLTSNVWPVFDQSLTILSVGPLGRPVFWQCDEDEARRTVRVRCV